MTDIQEEITNCGVLFYYKNFKSSGTSSLCFLLAQEADVEGYKNSNTWSAFEGGRVHGETAKECALRECEEESLEVVMPTEELRRRLDGDVPQITLKVFAEGKCLNTKPFVRSLYLVKIDKDATLPARFHETRAELLKAVADIERYDELVQEALEMKLPAVGYPNAGAVFLDIFHVHLHNKIMWVHFNGIKGGECINSIGAVSVTPEIQSFWPKYLEMVSLWTRIKTVVSIYKGIFVPVKHQNKILRSYKCQSVFLEKKNVAWLSSDTIVKNLRPSRRNKFVLRYNFAVMLSLILDNLGRKI
jgi:hypothetical protein